MMIVDHDITAVCITEGFSCAATETLIMATTSYVITDADVGRVLPITDGFLTNLTMTAPRPVYEVPSSDEGKQICTAGYFVLRGSGDNRDAVCITPAGGGFAQWREIRQHGRLDRLMADIVGGQSVSRCRKGQAWKISALFQTRPSSPARPTRRFRRLRARVARNRP